MPDCSEADGHFVKFGNRTESVGFRLPNAANGTEAFLELIDAAFRIDELGKPGEERMGIGSDADGDEAMLHTVDDFFLFRSLGRAADEALTGGHINEDDRIIFRMKVLFHENSDSPRVSDAAGRGK